ncbi:MAG: zinc-binding dehydrogenase [Chloroflexota bacterium]|nr:zinc-binding dehydrogenase [Dehalococcoidia bacterium]MDW8253200.1 zinc-binding dehydrogenase [Chloroflexota bacterium]
MTVAELWFVGPRQAEVRRRDRVFPQDNQVLVRALRSAVSAGTELLVYRGELPDTLLADERIAALQVAPRFPLQYGYAFVGRVIAAGPLADPRLVGRRVFAFAPHAAEALVAEGDLLPIPDEVATDDAALYPSLETAATLVLDARPLLGEKAVVIGQGVVGLLVTALLARFPLGDLLVIDPIEARRARALALGAHWAGSPADLEAALARLGSTKADLAIELSGRPEALDLALAAVGFAGRIIVGSWYGTKRAPIDLGGRFHRDRITIVSSQVSTLAPALAGRWDRARRTAVTWQLIREIRPSSLITDRVPIEDAPSLYRRLDAGDPTILQALITYGADD